MYYFWILKVEEIGSMVLRVLRVWSFVILIFSWFELGSIKCDLVDKSSYFLVGLGFIIIKLFLFIVC